MFAAIPEISVVSCFYCAIYILLSFIVICIVWIALLTLYYKINIGEPPIKELCLAYKYSYLGRSSSLCFKKLYTFYPDYKLVKLCYCGPNKSSHVEYANAIVVSDVGLTPDAYMIENLIRNGLSLFKTPSITHAISVCFPTISWLPATKWLAIAVAYPKLFSYVKEFNLCAYPVLELYNKSSVTVMIPLLRQDEFIVKEAERLVNGRQYSAMLSPLSVASHYTTMLKLNQKNTQVKKLSKANSSSRVNKGERKG